MIEVARNVLALLDAPTRRRVGLLVLASIVLAGLEMLGVALVLPLLQLVAGGDDAALPSWLVPGALRSMARQEALLLIAASVFLAFLMKGIVSIFLLSRITRFMLRRENEVAARLLRSYLHADWSLHSSRNSADGIHRIEVCTSVLFAQVVPAFVAIASELLVMAGIGTVLFVLQPISAMFAAAYFALLFALYQRYIQRRNLQAGRRVHEGTRTVYRVISDSLRATKEISVRGRQEHFVQQLYDIKTGILADKQLVTVLGQAPRYYLEIALIVGVGSLGAVLGLTAGYVSAVASLGLFLAAGFRLLPSLQRILVSVTVIRGAVPVVESITEDFRVMSEQHFGAEEEGVGEALRPVRGDLLLDNVSFRYPGVSQSALDRVSLKVPVGHSVGLVGPSGAGKSTLTDLALGLLTTDGGTVFVDGVPIEECRPAWQHSIGYVPQHIALLDDTVRANVALGLAADEIDDERLLEALDIVHLTEMLRGLPRGLDTIIGESGARLSGGQRQRIGIARALYIAPRVLVLDEATSALDSETERIITQTMEMLRGDVTVLVVAHRLSTVKKCDKIVYMDGGRVLDEGTFDELLERLPQFARAVELGSLQADV